MPVPATRSLFDTDAAGLSSADRILRAAIECFAARGYHGTSIREVATRAGVSVPGLYHHFSSKDEMLVQLMNSTMDDLLDQTEAAVLAAGDDVVERFVAAVTAHVRFHCDRPEEAFVGNTELRSLSPEARTVMVAKRDRQQRTFDLVIHEAVRTGVFSIGDPILAGRALVTMCTAVSSWYRRSGPLSPDQVVRAYRELALNFVRYEPSGGADPGSRRLSRPIAPA